MRAYLIRRLLLIIPTLLLVTIVVFFTIRLIPGSVVEQMLWENMGGAKDIVDALEGIKHKLGLDVPIHIQYLRWMGNIILHGDLGKSLWTSTPVSDEIVDRLPVSFELGLLGIAIALLIALPVGMYSAIRQDTIGDYIARSFAIICIAVPSFWLGTLVMVYPSIWWNWTPPMDYVPFLENPIANLGMFIIPATILGMALSGLTMRMTRTMMLEVLRQDYIRTAWSKGLRERVVIMRHTLKNALIPVVTLIGLQLPVVIGGSVVIEQIFLLPGIGRLLVEAIGSRNYTILSGINLFMATFVLLANLLVDLTYAYFDPRIRYK
jgi:peptide/nickel transport system permease protein